MSSDPLIYLVYKQKYLEKPGRRHFLVVTWYSSTYWSLPCNCSWWHRGGGNRKRQSMRAHDCVCVKQRERKNSIARFSYQCFKILQMPAGPPLQRFPPSLPFCKLHSSQMRHSRNTNSELKTHPPPVEKQTKAANVLWLKKFSNKVAVIYCPCS